MISLNVIIFLAVLTVANSYTDARHDRESSTEEYGQMPRFRPYRGPSHFLNTKKDPCHHDHPTYASWDHNPRVKLTCDKFPRVCHVKGSPGPDCCNTKCVNVKIDRNNCGMCGLKCRYPKVCCDGRCVNPFYDMHHCGVCHNKCHGGNFCNNGMCNYA